VTRQRIAFVDEFASVTGAIDSIGLDGRDLRRLRDGYDAAASRDGSELAFEGDGGLNVMRADGTHDRQIDVEGSTIDGQPAWSPDGKRIVFTKTISPAPSGALFQSTLYTIDPNGSGRRRLVTTAFNNPGPSWIDAKQILITAGSGRLAIISAETGKTERTIELPVRGTQPAPDPPALAPDGREIAYVECDNADCSFSSVDLISLKGRLLRHIRGGHTPSWTPGGDLLYACCGQAGIHGQQSRIMFAPRGGGPAKPITPPSISADDPRWLG